MCAGGSEDKAASEVEMEGASMIKGTKGTRVRLSARGIESNAFSVKMRSMQGTVTSEKPRQIPRRGDTLIPRDVPDKVVTVKWDGLKTPMGVNVAFLDRVRK